MAYLLLVTSMVLGLLAFWAIIRLNRSGPLPYELVDSIGLGDLSEVHGALRDDKRFIVKIPRVPHCNPLMAKEHDAIMELRKRAENSSYLEYLPDPVETFEQEGRRINVFRWRDGFRTAEEIRKRYPEGLDGRHLAWMFNRTLEVLGFVHRAGWIHGAVLPPHLMFHPEDHALMLVGWIHAERLNRPLSVVPARFADWYPRECRDRAPLTPSVDIFLAAKTVIHLAGGDPVRGEVPKAVPNDIRRFLKACLLETPRSRCQDAWQLHEEFTQLLEGVYGFPKYHNLVMT